MAGGCWLRCRAVSGAEGSALGSSEMVGEGMVNVYTLQPSSQQAMNSNTLDLMQTVAMLGGGGCCDVLMQFQCHNTSTVHHSHTHTLCTLTLTAPRKMLWLGSSPWPLSPSAALLTAAPS